jgi:ribosomal protein L37AE/L43A
MMSSTALQCRKCHTGRLAKGPRGWACESCGYAPFAEATREKVPPPAPVVVRTPLPEQVTTSNFGARPAGAPAAAPTGVLFSSHGLLDGATHMLWGDAGNGVRFAAEVPLQVLPTGEPLNLRVLVNNPGPYVLSAELFVVSVLGDASPQARRIVTGDLPPGSVLDATYPLLSPNYAARCHLAIFCRPRPPTGNGQDPWRAPPVQDYTGALDRNLPSVHSRVEIRDRAHCPRCEGRMRWVPAQASKPRAWVCEECAHRVETGILS